MEIYVKESLFASEPTQGKSVRPTVEEPVHNDGVWPVSNNELLLESRDRASLQ